MSGWSVQQKGSGSFRDLIVIAHGGVTETIRQVAPEAAIVGIGFPALKGHYVLKGQGAGMLPPLVEIVRAAIPASEGCQLRRLVLCGFSEGCQAVRAWLAAGEVPSAVLVIDGAHGSKPTPSEAQVIPWRQFFARAINAGRYAAITATRIPTTTYLPTATMLPILTGFPPPPPLVTSGASIEPETVWQQMPAWSGVPYQRAVRGQLVAEQWPGTDGPAHVQQAREVLPRLLGESLAAMTVPAWVRGYSVGPRPPEETDVVFPPIPGGGGGGGGGGRPPPSTPTTPPPAPPVPVPPPDSGGAGGAAAVLGLFGLGLVALSRAR